MERKITHALAATIGYSGSHSWNIVGNGNAIGLVSYGVDINVVPGDLITHESLVRTGLNSSFGAINYADNDRYANYNGVFFDVKGRFSRGFLDVS